MEWGCHLLIFVCAVILDFKLDLSEWLISLMLLALCFVLRCQFSRCPQRGNTFFHKWFTLFKLQTLVSELQALRPTEMERTRGERVSREWRKFHHTYLTPTTAPKPGSFWPEPWMR
jgi:hypothetical protein